jgi:general L-amino acid transport system permease protein
MTEKQTPHFVRSSIVLPLGPPQNNKKIFSTIRNNLFSTWGNAALTLLSLYLTYLAISAVINFAFLHAVWPGEGREACSVRPGACWPFIEAKLGQLIYGRYPETQRWRIDLAAALAAAGFAPLFIRGVRAKRVATLCMLLTLPAIALLLIGGSFGLMQIETQLWGGLFLTIAMAAAGIAASLPLGIVLALGRRSEMPVIRWLSTGFIELCRGAPLVTVLFVASVMVPLFLPPSLPASSKLLRALAAITVFTAAYVAEVVRGGLQSVPQGQFEAAAALGFGHWRAMFLVVLPQAIRTSIPSLVNSFIALFKDTTLVLTIGLFDFLGMIQFGLADPNWAAPSVSLTAYLFAGAVYWTFCFCLSRYAGFLEQKLNAGTRPITF